MNKFDTDNSELMMKIIDAESRHPRPEELPTHRFPVWKQFQVKAGKTLATAVGYTKSYGLVQWTDVNGEGRLEWVAADLISRWQKA